MLDFLDAHPGVTGLGLRRRDRKIVVSYIFILAGEKAAVTSGTSLDIHGKSISSHLYPSHFLSSQRHELGVMPGACFDSILDEVSRLIQPALSVEPGCPGTRGSYLAELA
jgi:hypothetical protein